MSSIDWSNMKAQLTKNEIINFLRAEKAFLSREFGVVDIGIRKGAITTGQ
jgi:hypothetical protein